MGVSPDRDVYGEELLCRDAMSGLHAALPCLRTFRQYGRCLLLNRFVEELSAQSWLNSFDESEVRLRLKSDSGPSPAQAVAGGVEVSFGGSARKV